MVNAPNAGDPGSITGQGTRSPMLQLRLGQPNQFKKINVSNFLCGHGAAPPLSDQPRSVPTNRGHLFNRNPQGRHASSLHLLLGPCPFLPLKEGTAHQEGDERGPQDQEWGKKLSTGPPRVISADFQEEGEPKSQKVHTRGTLLEKRKVLSHSTAHPSTTAPLRLLTQRVPSAYFLNLFFFPPFTFP